MGPEALVTHPPTIPNPTGLHDPDGTLHLTNTPMRKHTFLLSSQVPGKQKENANQQMKWAEGTLPAEEEEQT